MLPSIYSNSRGDKWAASTIIVLTIFLGVFMTGSRVEAPVGWYAGGKAILIISTEPSGASIYLDGVGEKLDTTVASIYVTPGKHVVTLMLDGYESYSEIIVLSPGKSHTINVKLVKK